MKGTLALIFFTLLSGLSFGQATKIGDHLTVKFPSQPEIQQVGHKTLYIINDSSYVINVMRADMSSNPNFNIRPDQLSEFYRGVINGTLDAAADSKLLSETTIKVGQYEGREIKYTKDFNGIDDIPVTKRILLAEKEVYTLDFWHISKEGQRKLEKQFFKSIRMQ